MNRRGFIKLLGLAPLIGLVAKMRAPKVVQISSGLSLRKLTEAKFLLDSNDVTEDRWFALSKTQVSRVHSEAFTEQLEAEGKLTFTEDIDHLPMRAHCIQVRHVHAGKLDRFILLDADEDLESMLPKIREQTRTALRRYWAQQARWTRKAAIAEARRDLTAVYVGDGKFEWRHA